MTEPDRTRVLVDTHVLLWWQSAPDRLSPRAAEVLATATTVLVSSVSAWEVALLVDAGRLRLDRPVPSWVNEVLGARGVEEVPLDGPTAVAAVDLGRRGFHRDPADRFLYATAERFRVPLVSKDEAVRAFADRHGGVLVLW